MSNSRLKSVMAVLQVLAITVGILLGTWGYSLIAG